MKRGVGISAISVEIIGVTLDPVFDREKHNIKIRAFGKGKNGDLFFFSTLTKLVWTKHPDSIEIEIAFAGVLPESTLIEFFTGDLLVLELSNHSLRFATEEEKLLFLSKSIKDPLF